MQAADYGISTKANNGGTACETTNGDTRVRKCNSQVRRCCRSLLLLLLLLLHLLLLLLRHLLLLLLPAARADVFTDLRAAAAGRHRLLQEAVRERRRVLRRYITSPLCSCVIDSFCKSCC